MSTTVHSTAVVDQKAQLAEGVEIGPYCTVGPHVKIGANTRLISHVVVDGFTTIGTDNEIHPFSTIGVPSQDLKFVAGTETYCTIDDRNIIRESVSVHSATEEGTATRIGSDNALLAHAHVGHNSDVGNHVIMSHMAVLGGHVVVEDYANLGGLCGVHQFCRVGRHAMIGGFGPLLKDLPPYMMANGHPALIHGVNTIGMQRAGLSKEAIRDAREVYKTLYLRGLVWREACERVQEEFGESEIATNILAAITNSKRGIANPPLHELAKDE